MRFLMSALIAEGKSDDRFLPFLLRRVLEEVCAREFTDTVDIDQVNVLRHRSGPPTIAEIIGLVEDNANTYQLVFVHRDQDGSTERVQHVWIDRLVARWGTERSERFVPVVPIRKTEAWVLADGEALRDVLGINWSDAALGVPSRPRDVERIVEPKEPIGRLVQRLGRPIEDFYEELADTISLELLRQVPSFASVRQQMVEALAGLGYHRY